MSRRVGIAAVCLLTGLVACGGTTSDGIDGEDENLHCAMQIVGVTPSQPITGAVVVLAGDMETANTGWRSYHWRVVSSGVELQLDPVSGSGEQVSFMPANAGVYQVTLSGTAGSAMCTDATLDPAVNVTVSGAITSSFRLRIVPTTAMTAVTKEFVVAIPGGGDYDLGPLTLERGVLATGKVVTPQGVGIGAYLRAQIAGEQELVVEAFADQDGNFEFRLPEGDHDLLVSPNALPPVRLTSFSGDGVVLTVPAGNGVSGRVADFAGNDLVGATVSISVDGTPSTASTTDSAGAFSLFVPAGGVSAHSVRAPSGAGLFDLWLEGAPAIADGNTLEVTYADVPVRSAHFDVLAADGVTLRPDARLVFVARPRSDAGTIEFASGEVLFAEGRARVHAIAGEAGHIAGLLLPEAVYDVLVESTNESVASVLQVDLSAGQPSPTSLVLSPEAVVTGRAVNGFGEALVGVRVLATSRGSLMTGRTKSTVTGIDGEFSISLAAGVPYELAFLAPPSARFARTQTTVTPLPGSVSIGDLELQNAIHVAGRATVTGVGAAAGAHVMLLCNDCTGTQAAVPLAEAVADATGEFRLTIPDPGVDGP